MKVQLAGSHHDRTTDRLLRTQAILCGRIDGDVRQGERASHGSGLFEHSGEDGVLYGRLCAQGIHGPADGFVSGS